MSIIDRDVAAALAAGALDRRDAALAADARTGCRRFPPRQLTEAQKKAVEEFTRRPQRRRLAGRSCRCCAAPR